jgi:hypothetical protein
MRKLFFMWGNAEPRAVHASLTGLTLTELHLCWPLLQGRCRRGIQHI